MRRQLRRLWGEPEPRLGAHARVGSGSVALVADNAAALTRLAAVLPPDFRIVDASDGTPAAREAASGEVAREEWVKT